VSFDLFQLPDDYKIIRDAVRELCADKVAPHAAAADESGEFPQASYDALRVDIQIADGLVVIE
jgi:hypothetical protein